MTEIRSSTVVIRRKSPPPTMGKQPGDEHFAASPFQFRPTPAAGARIRQVKPRNTPQRMCPYATKSAAHNPGGETDGRRSGRAGNAARTGERSETGSAAPGLTRKRAFIRKNTCISSYNVYIRKHQS